MSKISKASSLCLLLLFFFLFTSRPALSLRGPKLQSEPKSAQNLMDDSSSMNKIDSKSANSMIAGFFSHKFPLRGWPFPKYPPFTMVNPNIPTNPSGAQEESVKLPSSPSKDNKDGGNA
ncbi:Tapetum specific TAP35/TAP44 [Arabidopsis suecica]|uniref:Tapetum specific TAP35/TAP44 n=1 Tax=Arabidopsis suecica TaxID=45249 RepID=A0A8T1XNN9_ARASU|nr:Tapetum specific TAP35/TAP44 [Arabidopsis suecica]